MRSTCSTSARRYRGVTVADTVVLLVAVVFLVGGLMFPLLSRARAEATSDTCASHLANIGKAMLVYAADHNDALPRAAGRNSIWLPVVWNASTRQVAYGTILRPSNYGVVAGRGTVVVDPNNVVATGGNCTISSCLYLLVKYCEIDPNQFVCPQDPNTSVFALDLEDPNSGITELTQAWDFGSKPQTHSSYTYHAPWSAYALKASDDPNRAVAADRNPYIASPGNAKPKTFVDPNDPTIIFAGKAGDEACQKYGNSTVHAGEGQNVLFLDGRVSFETRAYCSLEDDNIYTCSRSMERGDPQGMIPSYNLRGETPRNGKDALLLHDPPTFPPYTPPTRGS